MATARIFHFSEEDLAGGSGGGAYAEFDVPCEVPVRLVKVEDYDKRAEGKSFGWIMYYMAETPSGREVEFRNWISFLPNSRWKLRETFEAHGVDLDTEVGVDPDDLVGDELIGLIDFPRDKQGNPTSEFRELRKVYPLSVESPFSEAGASEPEELEDLPEVL